MNRRDGLAAGSLTVLLVALLVPLVRIGVDPHHDGAMFKPALDVLSGQVLFRDSFMQYGALSCYLQALALWIQPTLLSVRLTMVAAYAVTLVSLYAAWRMLLPRSLTVVACVLFFLFNPAYETEPWNHEHWLLLPWSSAYAMMFQGIGLYALFRVIRGEQPERWGLVLGLAAAAVFWCRQPVGVTMIGALIVIWPALLWTGWQPAASSRRAILIRILAGFFILNAVFVCGLALHGALPAWWYQNIVWPARWSQSMVWGDTLPLVVHPGAAAGQLGLALALVLPAWLKQRRPGLPWPALAAWYAVLAGLLLWQHDGLRRVIDVREGGWTVLLPLAVLGLVGERLVAAVQKREGTRPVEYYLSAALAVFCLGSLPQYYPMADVWHVFYALAPVFGLFVYAIWRWSGWSAALVAALFAAVLLPAAATKARAIPPALARPLVTLTQPAILRGMRVPPEQARSFAQVAEVVALVERHRPDMPVAMIGDNALYLAFARNQTNPTPYYVTWPGLAAPADNERRWAYIQRTRPLMILQNARWEAVDDFYRRQQYVPLLYVPAEALEIAVPRELADAMGVKLYGIFGIGRPRARP